MSQNQLFSGRIHNCFDSHVHWRATGQFSRYLNLKSIGSPQDIQKLKISPENFQGDWLIGYGWDQNHFEDKKFPTRFDLDQIFSDIPVLLKRIDGHAAWVNTAALKRAQLFVKNIKSPSGGLIELDQDGWPTGIFIDNALNLLKKFLPEPGVSQQKAELLSAQTVFHKAGFTHIRDLTCDDLQWQAASELESSGDLQLAVEQFFSADDPSDFDKRVDLALRAKRETHRLLRPKGIKVYFDGALGSEGALISQPYARTNRVGLQLIHDDDLLSMMKICREKKLEMAIHTIGDEAAHKVASIAKMVHTPDQPLGLHLEHAELLRPETIEILTQLNVTCHMQPCHWLSDKLWLQDKIGDLSRFAFRWHDLTTQNIKVFFGSDSPIEPTSIQKNIDAIFDAEKNFIKAPVQKSWSYHENPDRNWVENTFSEFMAGEATSVFFEGQKLF